MLFGCDDRVLKNHQLEKCGYFVKLQKNEGVVVDDETSKTYEMPSKLTTFILNTSKRIINIFSLTLNRLRTNRVFAKVHIPNVLRKHNE